MNYIYKGTIKGNNWEDKPITIQVTTVAETLAIAFHQILHNWPYTLTKPPMNVVIENLGEQKAETT